MPENISIEQQGFGAFLLDAGIALLRAGASASRIQRTINRFCTAYGYDSDLHIGPKTVSLSLMDKTREFVFNGTRSSASYGVDFKIITGITKLSWQVHETALSVHHLNDELHRVLEFSAYSRFTVLFAVSIAGAAFCYTFGGSYIEMAITFGATFFGLFTKQILVKKSVNTFICTYISAWVAAFFIGIFYVAGPNMQLEHAFSTCALFLIPGLPLINFIIDLVAGNTLFGLERGIHAVIHAFAIAAGLTTVLYIFNVVS